MAYEKIIKTAGIVIVVFVLLSYVLFTLLHGYLDAQKVQNENKCQRECLRNQFKVLYALYEYKEKHHVFPDELKSLIDDGEVVSLPVCPKTKEELRYFKTEEGCNFVLFCNYDYACWQHRHDLGFLGNNVVLTANDLNKIGYADFFKLSEMDPNIYYMVISTRDLNSFVYIFETKNDVPVSHIDGQKVNVVIEKLKKGGVTTNIFY